MIPGWTHELREWQGFAYEKYLQHQKSDFLLVATPGAGKTTFALRIAHHLLQSGIVEQFIVVCPTTHLKKQWAQAGANVGIEIDPDFSFVSTSLRTGFLGLATTYQQVAVGTSNDLFRIMCNRRPTLVILDEIHHAGESLAWGNAVKDAFSPSDPHLTIRHLALSGTPFRSDNNKIPFVTYGPDQVCKPDYSYGYAESLREEVCRYVFFPKYEGHMEWISGEDGDFKAASFQDEISERQAAERLNTAIHQQGDWIKEVIRDANNRLIDIRNGEHRTAGGLIIARDQIHADAISKIVELITGQLPVLAISDDPDASVHIEEFRKSSAPWIVAVKMVSEGVDIPRLRVAIYATNVTSELFFRQAVGRVVRHIRGLEDENAFFYIPNDRSLVAHALAIKEEREHALQDEIDAEYDDEVEYEGATLFVPSKFSPISSEAERDGAIFDHSGYTQQEIDQAAALGQQVGFPTSQAEAVAHLIRLVRSADGLTIQTSSAEIDSSGSRIPLHDRLYKMRKLINTLVNRYVMIMENTTAADITQQNVHYHWIQLGGKPQPEADMDELKRKEQWLRKLIKEQTGE